MSTSSRFLGRVIPALLLGLLLLTSCTMLPAGRRAVVVYTSVDRVFSEPILDAFEAETGIEVLPVYDVEAAKTTGLMNRLIAEKDRPKADVFWSGEFAMTITLQDEGVLAPYRSDQCADIPAVFVDPEYHWIGFAGRARVLIVNTDEVPPDRFPRSIYDLLDPAWPADRVGIAYPMFGTTATQAAALYADLGPEAARDYFQGLVDRGVRVVDGNSVVRDMVAAGQLAFGLTDTDDACSAVERGDPVAIVFPDQGEGDLGTLVIPNTVALVAGGPNPEQGRAFIDYLVSVETEQRLVDSGWSHVPVRPLESGPACIDASNVRAMDVALGQVYRELARSQVELGEMFVR
jgi:iron(III) transport system substrate-binding protein